MNHEQVSTDETEKDAPQERALFIRFPQKQSPIHDYGVTGDGEPFIVMDYVEGQSLAQLIKSEGKLEPSRAVPIFNGICEALH